MTSFRKLTVFGLALAAILGLALTFGAFNSEAGGQISDPLYFPILLVHGLGEGPGEETFGQMQKYLKTFYYNSDVLDFDDYGNHDLADLPKAKQGNLGVLAAILGNKIEDMKKDFKTTKVNIIAHSYGGLIVNAYLADLGLEHDAKKGGFGNDVHKIIYLQTPFYGATGDADHVADLAALTNYGPFTSVKEITSTLELGSSWISTLDTALRKTNVIEEGGVDVVTFASDDDEVTRPNLAVLTGFTSKLVGPARYRVFTKYAHATNELSVATAETPKSSMAYVENIIDENFIAILSFLDGTFRWQRIGDSDISETALMMLTYEKEPGFVTIDEDDVELNYKSELQGVSLTKKQRKAKNDFSYYFNNKARTWFYYNMVPGNYRLLVKNSKNDGIDEELPFGEGEQVGFDYFPKDNQLMEGENRVNSDLSGLFVQPEFVITNQSAEYKTAPLTGLNTDGFEVEMILEGADHHGFNQGVIFSIYNQDGSSGNSWQYNGSRLTFMVRGAVSYENGPKEFISKHEGKLTWVVSVDKNKSGQSDYEFKGDENEVAERKSEGQLWDWTEKHHMLFRVQTIAGNRVLFEAFVDGEKVWNFEKAAPYWNPNPWISLGGRRMDDDYSFVTVGAKLSLAVRNIK